MALDSRRLLAGKWAASHALGTLAQVASKQGAACPGRGVAAKEREQGTSVESLAGKVPDLPGKPGLEGS